MNAERAWLMADLAWYDPNRGRLIFEDKQGSPDMIATTTHADFEFTLRNDGRTPAWIEMVFAGMKISSREKRPERMVTEYVAPLGAGQQRSIRLKLSCDGKPKMEKSETLAIEIKVMYRDIFQDRFIELEFIVDPLTQVLKAHRCS